MKFSRGIDMSLVVEITNIENLKKARKLLGAKSDGETRELALEFRALDGTITESRIFYYRIS